MSGRASPNAALVPALHWLNWPGKANENNEEVAKPELMDGMIGPTDPHGGENSTTWRDVTLLSGR